MAQAPLGSKPGGSAAAVTTHTAGEAPYAPDTGRSAAYYTPREALTPRDAVIKASFNPFSAMPQYQGVGMPLGRLCLLKR